MHVYSIMIIIKKQTSSQLNSISTYKKILHMKRLKDNMIVGVIGLIILMQIQPQFSLEHSSSMTSLTLSSLDIGFFTREGQDILINKFLYPGFEQTVILGSMSYISGMERTRNIRIILQAVWINNMWYSLRHNKLLLDEIR